MPSCSLRGHTHDFLSKKLVFAIAGALAGWARGDNLEPANRILSPALGRPAVLSPGERFNIIAQVAGPADALAARLVDPRFPDAPLTLDTGKNAAAKNGGGRLSALIPPGAPERVYDLELSGAGWSIREPHCVAVRRLGPVVRVVHLGNLNLGDLLAPRIDPRLIEEVNLVAPDVIVCAGDYLDATQPDLPHAWDRLVADLCRFEAPLILGCGDHDDVAEFSRRIAPSPVGEVRVGPHRALIALDHGLAPLRSDPEQQRWLERAASSPCEGMTWIVSNDEAPNLLALWQAAGTLPGMTHERRVGLFFAGGYRDWDNVEYRPLIEQAAPLLYVRTQRSSSAIRDGAAGPPHYRIIDVNGIQATIVGEPTGSGAPPASIAVGALSVELVGSADGSSSRVALDVRSGAPMRIERAARWVRVRKNGGQTPWAVGARLTQTIDRGAFWECRAEFDLPERGALRALIGADGPAPTDPLSVVIQCADSLTVQELTNADGIRYCAAPGASALVTFQNSGASPAELTPLIRLDGDLLAYRESTRDEPYTIAGRYTLAAGQSLSLQVDLSAIRVRRGWRELQVYLTGREPMVPVDKPLRIDFAPATARQ